MRSPALRTAAAVAGIVTAMGLTAACTSTTSPTGSHTAAPVSRPAPPSASVSVSVSAQSTTRSTTSGSDLPHPAHIVVVVLENRAYGQIIGSSSAPWLNGLAKAGALMTRSYATTHPSQPNYVALFSGSTHGLTDDSCPHSYHSANLAAELLHAHDGFVGYAEGLPAPGYAGCTSGDYARKHAPWTNFPALPRRTSQPFTAFPRDYSRLPTMAWVIPDLEHDMHNGTIAQADHWLRTNLGAYATWARSHNSLLVITWDENDGSPGNRIPTIIAGAHVRSGDYREHVTDYRLLRTLEALDGVAPIGAARATTPITGIWS